MTAATPTRAARARLSPESVRAALIELGLREEEKPLDGYAFTYRKHPTHAVDFYRETHGGAEAHRFYCQSHQFILSE